MRSVILVLGLALAAGGCGLAQLAKGPVPDGWTREQLSMRTESCANGNCRLRLVGSAGRHEVTSRIRDYARHEIPGWDDASRTERAANSAFAWAVRRLGGTSEHVRIGLGTLRAAPAGGEGLQLECTVFWLDDVERRDDDEWELETASVRRRAQGTRCTAADPLEPDAPRWHYADGIAPPRDSLALVYDSLSAEGSPLLGVTPPITLARLAPGGEVAERYVVDREPIVVAGVIMAMRLHVARATGEPVAVLHPAFSIDLAPSSTPEERSVLRLVAAVLLASMQDVAR